MFDTLSIHLKTSLQMRVDLLPSHISLSLELTHKYLDFGDTLKNINYQKKN